MKSFIAILFITLALVGEMVRGLPTQNVGADIAQPCDEAACQLPDCYCSTTAIPDDLAGSSTPQIITLTFIGNIAANYYSYYSDLLKDRVNPNGCPVTATFFVAHDYSDYSSINSLAAQGHEIAVNTISASQSSTWTVDQWTNETAGMREILGKFGLIDPSSVVGSRAPYFQHGGNIMAQSLSSNGFIYDSSIISYDTITTPVWPYSMDYQYSYDCFIQPCVVLSYPGFWEYLITFLQSFTMTCETLPSCSDVKTVQDVYDVLLQNFQYHSATNSRAPYDIVLETTWFAEGLLGTYALGLIQFLDYIATLPDTYVLSVNKTLEWVQNPTTLSNINSFQPWQCTTPPSVGDCSTVYNCYYKDTVPGGERYVNFCSACPPNYPWVGNPDGL